MQTVRWTSLLCALVGCAAHALGSPSQGPSNWALTFGGDGSDAVLDAAPAPGGGFYVAGSTTSFSRGGSDGWVARVASDGYALWELALGGKGVDRFDSVAATADGGCILAGSTSSSGAGNSDGWVVKLSGAGALQWQRTYGTAGAESFVSVAVPSAFSFTTPYYVLGTIEQEQTGRDVWILKLDFAGSVIWQKRYAGELDDDATALAATSDGAAFVANSNSNFSPPSAAPGIPYFRPWIVRLDASGNPKAQRTFNLSGGDGLADIVQLADGGFALTGEILAMAFFRGDLWVLRLDEQLDLVWDRRFGDNFINWFDGGRRVRATPQGDLLVAGSTATAGAGSDDLWLLHLDGSGALLADRTFGEQGFDSAHALALGANGGILIGGTLQIGLGPSDAYLAHVPPSWAAAPCPPIFPSAPNIWTTELQIGTPTVQPSDTAVIPAEGTATVLSLATGDSLCR